MNCKTCKRSLKNVISVRRGYGPVCWKKVKQARSLEEWL